MLYRLNVATPVIYVLPLFGILREKEKHFRICFVGVFGWFFQHFVYSYSSSTINQNSFLTDLFLFILHLVFAI